MDLKALYSKLFPRPKIGLALGGGSARAIAHIGVLKVLVENKIPIDFIAGTSAGSIVGSLFASGMPIDSLVALGKRLKIIQFMRANFNGEAVMGIGAVEDFVKSLIGEIEFSDLKIPFAVLASDLKKNCKVVINSGKVYKAVMASAAFPGVYEPTRTDGQCLVDGGVFSNIPVDTVRGMGANRVIAVDVLPIATASRKLANLVEVLDASVDTILRFSSAAEKSRADLVLEPVIVGIGALEIEQGNTLIQLGEDAARKKLPEILDLVR